MSIYLDYNATTPVCAEAREAILPFLDREFGNPSSDYPAGRRSKAAIEEARSAVAALIGARDDEIVFTGCATESNNMAVKGVAWALAGKGRHIVTTAVEHPSVTNAVLNLLENGFTADFVGVDKGGMVSPEAVYAAIRPDTVLVSVMLANNETGSMQPVAGIGVVCRKLGVLFHVDAAQAVGKIPVDVNGINADLLTVAGHKVYAPKGVGALYVRKGVTLAPLFHGGGQERGFRAGTENAAFIAGLGAACRAASNGLEAETTRVCGLRDRFHDSLCAAVPGLHLNGDILYRLPNTLNVSFPKVSGAELLAAAPEIMASTGAACHVGGAVSHVLAAMGLSRERAMGAVRLSLGRYTTEPEIDRAAEILARAWRVLTE
ncbi:MAG: cysteine desulfurase [Deltaproteobacteria bacterium]|nr:cysteine desulfurase [Deltaproteobacteria bacterium]